MNMSGILDLLEFIPVSMIFYFFGEKTLIPKLKITSLVFLFVLKGMFNKNKVNNLVPS
jgi:hypothetical protein